MPDSALEMHPRAPAISGSTSAGSRARPGARRAILLDALGTLVALEPPAPALRRELAGRFGIELTEAEAQAAIAAEIAYYRAHLDEGRDAGALASLRARCAEALREALPERERILRLDGAALTETLLASLHFRAFEDAQPALAAARADGLRTVVVSNWDVSLHALLERLELSMLLDGIVTSAQTGARKPSLAIFEAALHVAGVEATRAIHVGDSLEEDVGGARGAGIEPVLLRRDGSPGPPGIRVVASLRELLDPKLGPP